MQQLSLDKIKKFQKEILTWYRKHKRDLPWRRTRDSYKILVSEIMLQQTQVSRVIPKYKEWLKRLPTINALAKAKTSDVLRLWSGLGYNRRALYLKRFAQIVVADYHGSLPQDEKTLKSLPGIGEYTARAIACFAFDEQVAMVDTNIRKVILIHFGKNHPERPRRNFGGVDGSHRDSGQARMTAKEIQRIADQLLPVGQAYDWNHALMDYSSAVLKRNRVPTTKQSKFVGSNRYYRGRIIKALIESGKLNRTELEKLLGKDGDSVQRIIDGLVRDGLIRISAQTLHL